MAYVVCPRCRFRQQVIDSWKTYTCKGCGHRNRILRATSAPAPPWRSPDSPRPPAGTRVPWSPASLPSRIRVSGGLIVVVVVVVVIAVVGVAALVHSGSHPAALRRPERPGGSAPVLPRSPAAPATTAPASHAPTHGRRSPAPQPTRQRARPSPHPRPSPRLDKSIPCPADALLGVYHPYRLHVLGACRWFSGRVTAVRHEDDGDYHVDIAPTPGEAFFLDRDNYSEQYGSLVTEIMPGQDFVVPFVGEQVKVLGTWVYDADHGWNEIHPIWAIGYPDGKVIRSLPPATPVYRGTAPKPKPKPRPRPTRSSGGVGSNCTPGYSPCLVWHGGADYDCYGGGGNGPYFTAPGVVYKVTGSDPYRLDSNGNGLGCE